MAKRYSECAQILEFVDNVKERFIAVNAFIFQNFDNIHHCVVLQWGIF